MKENNLTAQVVLYGQSEVLPFDWKPLFILIIKGLTRFYFIPERNWSYHKCPYLSPWSHYG